MYKYFPSNNIPIVSFNNFCHNSTSIIWFYMFCLIQVITAVAKFFANVNHKALQSYKDGLLHCKEMMRQILCRLVFFSSTKIIA